MEVKRLVALICILGCSANPLDADRMGCIKGPDGEDYCADGEGAGLSPGGNGASSAPCDGACASLEQCLDLSQTALVDGAGCRKACAADPTGAACLADAAGDCTQVQVCLSGGGAGDASVCEPACAHLAQCVDLGQTALGDEAGCRRACEADPQGSQCLASANDCAAVVACVPGNEDPCPAACQVVDACTPGGLASQGLSLADCQALCEQGQLGTQAVVTCLAQATTCEGANQCVP
jgi:hypothetical protein